MLNKAQLKVQQTAFMLIALVFLFAIVFLFYANFQLAQIYKQAEQLRKQNAIGMLSRLSETAEFYSAEGIDLDKVRALKNMSKDFQLQWRSLSKLEIMRLYPEKERIVIYDKNVREEETFSSFAPICETMLMQGYAWRKCEIGKILVSVEKK